MSADQLARVERLVADRFGIALSRYSPNTVRLLLAALPDDPAIDDVGAMSTILSACSVGETMFVRHPEQFAAVIDAVPSLPSWRLGRPLRVWSAGCATGEEAWSLAGMLGKLPGASVQVLGTDVNPSSVKRATEGSYRMWSMRGVTEGSTEDWLDVDGLDVRIADRLRPMVRFSVANLIGGAYPENLDLVFCRNVLLYFHEQGAREVIDRFAAAVAPGGVLVLGPFDPTPTPGGRWREEYSGYARIWRRADDEATPRVAQRAAAPRPIHRVHVARRAPARAPVRPPAGVDDSLREGLAVARGLAGQRSTSEAIRVLDTVLELHPFSVEAYVLVALISEERGDMARALDAARRACFLAPEEAIPQFLMGSCLEADRDPRGASAHFQCAALALAAVTDRDAPLPFGEGLTSAQVERMLHGRT